MINTYQQSLPIAHQQQAKELEIHFLTKLAIEHYQLGEHQEALEQYHQALSLCQGI